MNADIGQLATLLIVATLVGLVANRWRLPMVTAYLVTGLGLAAAGLFPAALTPVLRLFADFGIALLLFLVGLEINFSALRRVGWAALLVGFAQVCITEISLTQVRPTQIGSIQVGSTQIGTAQIYTDQTAPTEVCSAQIRTAQL